MTTESYAYRLETIRIAEPEFPYAGQTLSSPETAAFLKGEKAILREES